MDSLGAFSQDAARARDLFFNLPVPFSLKPQDYVLYWQLVDNIYSIKSSRDTTHGLLAPYTIKYIECRFRRPSPESATPKESGRRTTTKKAAKSCDVSFKILEFPSHVEVLGLEGQSTTHAHSLDFSDSHKRNSFVRNLALKEVAKGHNAAAVMGILRPMNDPFACAQLDSIGGKFLTNKDVSNWRSIWKVANPDALQPLDARSRASHLELATNELSNNIRARFSRIMAYADSLDDETRDSVLNTWENTLANLTNALQQDETGMILYRATQHSSNSNESHNNIPQFPTE